VQFPSSQSTRRGFRPDRPCLARRLLDQGAGEGRYAIWPGPEVANSQSDASAQSSRHVCGRLRPLQLRNPPTTDGRRLPPITRSLLRLPDEQWCVS